MYSSTGDRIAEVVKQQLLKLKSILTAAATRSNKIFSAGSLMDYIHTGGGRSTTALPSKYSGGAEHPNFKD